MSDAVEFGSLPKVELHCHLVGAIRTETLIDIHRARRLELPSWDAGELERILRPSEATASLADFLRGFPYLKRCLCDPEAIERTLYELAEDQAADGVAYLEVRFAPGDIHQDHGLTYDEIFAALERGAEAASRSLGIDVTLTPGISRERGPELGLEAAAASLANIDRAVTGFDLFGHEAGHPPELFEAAFRLAADAGLGITVHAGEAAGPESVIAAVRVLGARRIGHGVRAAESEEAIHLLSSEGVFVETCPTSNFQTRAVPALAAHPLPAFLAAGVRCGVFTDDPWVCGTTLSREYERAVSEIGVSPAALRGCVVAAAEAAFAPQEMKRRLRLRLTSSAA